MGVYEDTGRSGSFALALAGIAGRKLEIDAGRMNGRDRDVDAGAELLGPGCDGLYVSTRMGEVGLAGAGTQDDVGTRRVDVDFSGDNMRSILISVSEELADDELI